METAQAVLQQLGHAVLQLFMQPFYYISVFFIILQYSRQMRMERQLFAVKLHNWLSLTLKAVLTGLLAGAAVSISGVFIGASITPSSVLWLWAVAAVLMLIRIRYLCFAYSAGIIAILQWLIGFTPLDERADWLGSTAASLARIDAAGLLLLVALLHLAEALLVRWQGDRLSTPLFLEGKRGKLIGGYMLQGFWPVPLFLLVPATGDSASEVSLPWTPLFGADWSQGWTFVALPMMIGFTEMTRTMLPKAKARYAANSLLVYSVLLAGASLAAWKVPMLLPLAAVLSIALHETMVWRSKLAESKGMPLYVHDSRGLRVLGVVPGTPAEAMGLQPGEVLHKVNGTRVSTKEELYEALALNSAFCRLEVFNNEGELKFAGRARYAGEHHQLGVILSPDEQANFYAADGPASLVGLIRGMRAANRRGRTGTAESAAASETQET